jgi:putative peptide zinc metalloprotease protein
LCESASADQPLGQHTPFTRESTVEQGSVSVERDRLQTFWPGEDDIVPLPLADRIDWSGEGPEGAALRAAITRPPRLTAADFSPERMLRPRSRPPADGWRRAVYVATGGAVAVGPGQAELRRRQLVAQVTTPIRGCRAVAFVSRKGGVGKTTTCLLVGHVFASHRGDRVVAIDANPDAGTLGHRLRRESGETIATLLHDRAALARYADVRAYSSQAASRLEVIAGDDRVDADVGERDAVREAVEVLERHYNLVCLDTPAGVLSPTAQGVLDAADQLVIVSPTGLDGARAASSTLDWLEEHGHAALASSAVAVLNGVRAERSDVDVDRIEAHFASRCRACLRVPWDTHLETGAHVSLDELRPATREAFLGLAAAIARGFTEPAARRS